MFRDGIFWLPLIALFSGMRLGEIAQLLVDDLRTEDGAFYFDVTAASGEGKTLKTKSSRRRVPVHAKLIELGFASHVERAVKKNSRDSSPTLPWRPMDTPAMPRANFGVDICD